MNRVFSGKRAIFDLFVAVLIGVLAVSFQVQASSAGGALQDENLATLKAMTDEDRQGLDAKLGQALKLYYEEDYYRALPIFREIADRVETMDLMFWIGTSAGGTGDYRLAIKKFNEMLALDPSLYRVRLELADVLFKAGRMSDARDELVLVRASSPPAAVIRNIDRRLVAIGQTREKSRWAFNLSTGYQHDDNISSGPDKNEIALATGTLRLGDDQQETNGNNRLIKVAGNMLYDVGAAGDVIWSGRFSIYDSDNSETGTVDYTASELSTGPIWASNNYVFKVPVGFKNTRYGGEHLSDTWHVNPSLRYSVEDFGVQAAYSFEREDYQDAAFSGNDNKLHRLTVGPDFYLGDREYAVGIYVSYEDRDADSKVFSYSNTALEITCFRRFAEVTELFLKYKHSRRKYEAAPPLYTRDRVDDRDTLTIALSHRFMERYFVSLGYVYMRNDSNADLYTFEKNMVTLDLGLTF